MVHAPQVTQRQDAVTATEEAIRRWSAGEPMAALFAPEYAVVGAPVPFQAVAGTSPEDRRRQIQADAEIRFRSVTPGAGRRAVFEAVWMHRRPDGGGSSGLYWGVVTVRDDGLITRLEYLHDRDAARAAAGLT